MQSTKNLKMNRIIKLPVKQLLIVGLILLVIGACSNSKTTSHTGYPANSSDFDVLPGFQNPPKGYGNVPFYWWIGDTLTKERILWQLEQLEGMGITGLQINT